MNPMTETVNESQLEELKDKVYKRISQQMYRENKNIKEHKEEFSARFNAELVREVQKVNGGVLENEYEEPKQVTKSDVENFQQAISSKGEGKKDQSQTILDALSSVQGDRARWLDPEFMKRADPDDNQVREPRLNSDRTKPRTVTLYLDERFDTHCPLCHRLLHECKCNEENKGHLTVW